MKFLLDTNILIAALRSKNNLLRQNISEHNVSELGISIFSVAELYTGVFKSNEQIKNEAITKRLLSVFTVVSFTSEMCETYGKLRAALEKSGKSIGNMDLLISSQALHLDLIVVTSNEKEFNRVPGLIIENWLK